jgi:hypothetical protein
LAELLIRGKKEGNQAYENLAAVDGVSVILCWISIGELPGR